MRLTRPGDRSTKAPHEEHHVTIPAHGALRVGTLARTHYPQLLGTCRRACYPCTSNHPAVNESTRAPRRTRHKLLTGDMPLHYTAVTQP